jgi:hypothetical protein
VLEPPINWATFQYEPNLIGPLVEGEWSVEAEGRHTILTQTLLGRVVGMGTFWQHSQTIGASLVQLASAKTTQKLGNISAQTKSEGSILG